MDKKAEAKEESAAEVDALVCGGGRVVWTRKKSLEQGRGKGWELGSTILVSATVVSLSAPNSLLALLRRAGARLGALTRNRFLSY
jgi:hypothetical protein